jgi:site-specific DNA recombinase
MGSKIIPTLGAARLSQETDESTSIVRQTAGIQGWATFRSQTTGDDYRVIEVTQDSDVSGAVNPFDRPALGPCLRRPLLDTWQMLVVYRLDRLTRSIADFEQLWKFLEANGKTLVSVSENIDFGTPSGRLMARQLVLFAEYEREMIRARIKSAYDALRANGQYPGMQFPFGYMPVKLEPKGWGLELHPIYAPIVVEICERIIGGESLGSICRWLQEQHVPTPRNVVREFKGKKPLEAGAHWHSTSLSKILRASAVIGESVTGGKTYRDESGMAVKRADPLIERNTWEQVKAVLDANGAHIGPKVNISPLLQVAFCAKCGSPLYINKVVSKVKAGTKVYRYYTCIKAMRGLGCDARRMDADTLESLLHHTVLAQMGRAELTETEEIPGTDYSTQMTELAEAIGALSTQIALARAHGQDVSKLEERRRVHEVNLAKLAEEPTRLPETREVDTGETWADRWARLDWNGRNKLLRMKGIKFYAERDESGIVGGQLAGARYPLDEHGQPTPSEWVSIGEPAELTPPDAKLRR